MKLTEEEELLVRHLAQPGNWWHAFGYYVAFLVPMTGFCIYGLYEAQPVATALGLAGILAAMIWRIFDEWKYSKIYESLFQNILAENRSPNNG
jgi:hypothetical protein